MNLWTFLLGGTAFLGLFLTAGTLAGPGPRPARSWLALLLLSVSVFLLEFLAMQSGYYGFPVVFVTYPLVFAMGPAFWFLARAQSSSASSAVRPRDLLHATPLLLAAVNQLPYYRDSLAAGGARGIRPELVVPLTGYDMMGLHLAHLGVYVLLGVRLLRRRAGAQRQTDSGGIVDEAAWIARVAVGFAAIIGIQLAGTIVMATTGRHVDRHEYATALAISAVIVTVGWTMSRNARLLAPPRRPTEKYRKAGLAADELDACRRRLLEVVAGKRLYLDPDLGLDVLARAAGLPQHVVSQTLNLGLGLSFFDFVNRYRVRHAAELLLHPRSPNPTVLAVAFDSGFSSKASFNRAFRAHTGMTPSDFRSRATDDHPIFATPDAGLPPPTRNAVSSQRIEAHPAG